MTADSQRGSPVTRRIYFAGWSAKRLQRGWKGAVRDILKARWMLFDASLFAATD